MLTQICVQAIHRLKQGKSGQPTQHTLLKPLPRLVPCLAHLTLHLPSQGAAGQAVPTRLHLCPPRHPLHPRPLHLVEALTTDSIRIGPRRYRSLLKTGKNLPSRLQRTTV
jgi:hypothetical protein